MSIINDKKDIKIDKKEFVRFAHHRKDGIMECWNNGIMELDREMSLRETSIINDL